MCKTIAITFLLLVIFNAGVLFGFWVRPAPVEDCYPAPAPPEAQGISITTLKVITL